MIDKIFKYVGEASDINGIPSYSYIGDQWNIDIWIDSILRYPYAFQGTIEDMNSRVFEFTLYTSGYVTYSRVLESNYNGLGKQYDQEDKIIPKYAITAIRNIYNNIEKVIV